MLLLRTARCLACPRHEAELLLSDSTCVCDRQGMCLSAGTVKNPETPETIKPFKTSKTCKSQVESNTLAEQKAEQIVRSMFLVPLAH